MNIKHLNWLLLFYIGFITNINSASLLSLKNKISKETILQNSSQKNAQQESDTLTINNLIKIAWDIAPKDFEKSIEYADSAFELSQKIKWKRVKVMH